MRVCNKNSLTLSWLGYCCLLHGLGGELCDKVKYGRLGRGGGKIKKKRKNFNFKS